MGVPPSGVGYTSATAGRGNHEVHKGHVVALGTKRLLRHVSLPEVSYIHLIRISADEISALLVLMNNFNKYHFRKLCLLKCIIEAKYRTVSLNNNQTEVLRLTDTSACCFASHVNNDVRWAAR
jgi:hypothetical protein